MNPNAHRAASEEEKQLWIQHRESRDLKTHDCIRPGRAGGRDRLRNISQSFETRLLYLDGTILLFLGAVWLGANTKAVG